MSKHNSGMVFLGFFFIVALAAEIIFLPGIGVIKLPLLAVIIVVCSIHARRFAENKPIGPWFHFIWGAVYFVPAAFLSWQMSSYWLAGSFALERFVFYNPILNIIRFGWKRDKFFYIHAGKNGSWWDDLELLWSKAYPWIWSVALLGFIIFQFQL